MTNFFSGIFLFISLIDRWSSMTVPHPELLEARCFLGFPIRNHVIPIPLTLNLKYIKRVNSEETVVLRWWESITG